MLIDRVTRVRDADTIVVGLIAIRISNLDCTESGTAAGERATRRAKELVTNQTVQCPLGGRWSGGRRLCLGRWLGLRAGDDLGGVLQPVAGVVIALRSVIFGQTQDTENKQ